MRSRLPGSAATRPLSAAGRGWLRLSAAARWLERAELDGQMVWGGGEEFYFTLALPQRELRCGICTPSKFGLSVALGVALGTVSPQTQWAHFLTLPLCKFHNEQIALGPQSVHAVLCFIKKKETHSSPLCSHSFGSENISSIVTELCNTAVMMTAAVLLSIVNFCTK